MRKFLLTLAAALYLVVVPYPVPSDAAPAAPDVLVPAGGVDDCGDLAAYLTTRVCFDPTTAYGPVVQIFLCDCAPSWSFGVEAGNSNSGWYTTPDYNWVVNSAMTVNADNAGGYIFYTWDTTIPWSCAGAGNCLRTSQYNEDLIEYFIGAGDNNGYEFVHTY